jgi:hypothetical protein
LSSLILVVTKSISVNYNIPFDEILGTRTYL